MTVDSPVFSSFKVTNISISSNVGNKIRHKP